jgi:hypothetical protein
MRYIGLIAGTSLAGLLAAPAVAEDEAISYYLTKTDMSVALKLTLERCPNGEDTLPKIGPSWAVKASGAADGGPSAVQVDVSKGWLAKRSTAFTFNPNGTLAAFNAKAEGQAGAVLESVFKLIGTVAGIALPLPVRGPASIEDDGEAVAQPEIVACTAEVLAKLNRLGELDTRIGELEAVIQNGEPLAAQIALLEQLRTARAQIVKSLTITVPAVFTGDGKTSPWSAAVGEPPIRGKWFEPATSAHPGRFDINQIEGVKGYDIAIAARGPVGTDMGTNPTRDAPKRLLVYRRPVVASVTAVDKACLAKKGPRCAQTLVLDAPLLIGQWGRIEALKIGAGGLFGSREASAKFDQFGTPLELSYGSDSGAASIASAIGAAGDTATSIADADIAALEKAIKRAELRKKLDELNEE